MASLHVIGGYNGIEPLTTVEVYIPATNRWRTMTGMPTARSLVGGPSTASSTLSEDRGPRWR
jgi:hypothetical protein